MVNRKRNIRILPHSKSAFVAVCGVLIFMIECGAVTLL